MVALPIQVSLLDDLEKAKSKSNEAVDQSNDGPDESVEAIEKSPVGIEKGGSDETCKEVEKSPVGIEKSGSDETCKEVGVCEENVISTDLSNMGQVKSAPQLVVVDDDDDDDDDYGDGDEEEDSDEELDEEVDEEIEMEIVKKSFDVKEINITDQKLKQVVKEEKNIHQVQERKLPTSPIVKKQAPPLVNHSRTYPLATKPKFFQFQMDSRGFLKPILNTREFLKPIANCRV